MTSANSASVIRVRAPGAIALAVTPQQPVEHLVGAAGQLTEGEDGAAGLDHRRPPGVLGGDPPETDGCRSQSTVLLSLLRPAQRGG